MQVPKIPIHERIKEARLRAGFSNANQAAERLRIPYNTVARAETEGHVASDSTLRLLALGYGLPADAFIEEDYDPKPPEESVTIKIYLPAKLTPKLRILLIEAVSSFADNLARILNAIHNDPQ